jgi:hypothetical protein
MNSAFCSHLTNLSRIMTSCISRALTFGKCDMILLHLMSAKYLLHCNHLSSFNQQVGAGLQLQVAGKLDKISVLCKNWERKQKHSKLKPKNLQISTWIGTNFLGEFARILTVQTHPTKVRHYRTWRTQLSNSHIVQEQRTL